MIMNPVSGFDGIDYAVAAFESNLILPGEGGFFYYLVFGRVLSYLDHIRLIYIF